VVAWDGAGSHTRKLVKFETRNSKFEGNEAGDGFTGRLVKSEVRNPKSEGFGAKEALGFVFLGYSLSHALAAIRLFRISNFGFRIFPFLFLLATAGAHTINFGPEIVISVPDQQLAILEDGSATGTFVVSTSRFGIGDEPNSYKTPVGVLWVYDKIGGGLPKGAVIKDRSATGEVIPANARGRDPIVTRIIWLKGLFGADHAYERCIYIHGTPEEASLGRPSSWGCIRMRSDDVLKVYDKVMIGTHVLISEKPLKQLIREEGINTVEIPAR
jgi:hypothetical protein